MFRELGSPWRTRSPRSRASCETRSCPASSTALRTNLRQGRRDVALFEIGRVFLPAAAMPVEERRLGILLSGSARPAHWSEKARGADFFDAKGIVEAVLRSPRAWTDRPGAPERTPAFLHPGASARVYQGETPLGFAGVLHPATIEKFELREPTVVAEIVLDALLQEAPAAARFRTLERFPAVSRDLSILTGAERSAADLEASIRGAAGALLRAVGVVDRYDRPPVPAGKVSLTLSLLFQHPERTLTGDDVQDAMARVVGALRSSGAEIRGE